MIRRAFTAAAALVLLSGPVLADGPMGGGRAVFGSNSLTATNMAAGLGNSAQQGVIATQKAGGPKQQGSMARPMGGPMGGQGMGPLVTTNTAVSTNVAAGIGNTAVQGVGVVQKGGRGGLVETNTAVSTNVAAGIGNFGGQHVFSVQK